MNTRELLVLRKLRDDFAYYAPRCLKIVDKQSGQLKPFQFNVAQRYLHRKIEEQKKKIGKVRVILVKGRQFGGSTYVEGRYFHDATLIPGTSVFILAHIASSTEHLFGMAKRYYENAPTPILPAIDKMNERRLEFSDINSNYSVGTAGSAQIGRGTTIRRFHGSECAFYDHTAEIAAGVLQAVPDAPDTEIIFESTANGPGDWFHSMAIKGLEENSDGDFITIFVPWYWQPEYYREPPENFVYTPEEEEIAHIHKLSPGQICWRRKVIQDTFSGDATGFKREYPNTVHEAFTASGESLIKAPLVMAARKSNIHSPIAPVIGGCDPAREGDRTIMVLRRGREILKWFKYQTMDEMTCAGLIAEQIDKYNIVKYFIDVGCGYGTVDRLRELGYGDIVTPVHFGSGAMQADIFVNKRAEMADALREWFEDGAVNIPDDDSFHSDLTAVPPHKKSGSRGRLILVPKDEIKEKFGKSTDIFDACFIKDTKITVPGGYKNIQDLKIGDKVCTPFGVRNIIKTHIRKAKTLTAVEFSNGKTLIGKPEHKVFSFNSGLVPLSMLSLTNEIDVDNITRRILWRINYLLFTRGKSFGFKATASTIDPQKRISRRRLCRAACIPTTMAQFQKGCTSTIKTVIGQIIASRIWKWLRQKSITENTWLNGHEFTVNARDVGKSTRPSHQQFVNFAPPNAGKLRHIKGIKQKLEHAWSAVKNLFLTSTGLKSVVPTNVRTFDVAEQFVYNLTLDFDNMYYANGILVENCMLTFAFPVSPQALNKRVKRVEIDTRRPGSPLSTVRDFNRGPKKNTNTVTSTFTLS